MAEACPGLSSTEQVVLILLLLHPGWDATPPHSYPQHLTAEKVITVKYANYAVAKRRGRTLDLICTILVPRSNQSF